METSAVAWGYLCQGWCDWPGQNDWPWTRLWSLWTLAWVCSFFSAASTRFHLSGRRSRFTTLASNACERRGTIGLSRVVSTSHCSVPYRSAKISGPWTTCRSIISIFEKWSMDMFGREWNGSSHLLQAKSRAKPQQSFHVISIGQVSPGVLWPPWCGSLHISGIFRHHNCISVSTCKYSMCVCA